MRFRTARPREEGESIVPLINVVFLLLIFLMLIGKLSESNPFEILPPVSASAAGADQPILAVHLGPAGEIAIGGEIVRQSDVGALVRDRLEESALAEIRLNADQRVPAGRVIQLMETLRAAGVETVRLVTAPQKQ